MPLLRRPARRPSRTTARRLAAVVAALGMAGATLALAAPASGYAGAAWFQPNTVYTQNFPDPSVIRVGSDYYAYATGTGGSYLPVMRSKDQITWQARDYYRSDAECCPELRKAYPYFNDALPYVASWGQHSNTGMHMTSWVTAPGVAQFGPNRFNAYYGLLETKPDRACIAVATSTSPQGPFYNPSWMTRPLICQGDAPGSIDPQPFVDPKTGRKYLHWAGEGVGGNPPTKLWSQELTADGLGLVGGQVELTRTTQAWEGPMIENPSMVLYRGRYYLLYSANNWWTGAYATGYALCSGPLGPCHKPRSTPLLSSNGLKLG
ncbi:MAG TPA: glycoside hydrolase family 43 protein, partial [Mycobacteriales bacterium]|nr:glycoside hydrolase family 43 protein [Mycobacteriales bacterium]